MKVKARTITYFEAPEEIRRNAGADRRITVGLEYEVHSVAFQPGAISILIVDDSSMPEWLHPWIFDVVDSFIPHDWIVNMFGHDCLVMGPDFIARTASDYKSMLSRADEKIAELHRRQLLLERK